MRRRKITPERMARCARRRLPITYLREECVTMVGETLTGPVVNLRGTFLAFPWIRGVRSK